MKVDLDAFLETMLIWPFLVLTRRKKTAPRKWIGWFLSVLLLFPDAIIAFVAGLPLCLLETIQERDDG